LGGIRYSITSSARRRIDGGTARPRVLAVLVVWWRVVPLSEPEIRAFFDRTLAEQRMGLGWWLMHEPGGPLLGHATLKPLSIRPEWIEVGYHLLPDARGRGYATEAARALLGYGFNTLKLSEIYSVVSPHNAPSQAVMQRLGMPRAGRHQHGGMEVDLFRMRRDDWNATGGASACQVIEKDKRLPTP
jgi:RimJ/RimL family protein N-acetyltransferase